MAILAELRKFLDTRVSCSPGQDHQAVFQLTRSSAQIGAINLIDIGSTTVKLPKQGCRYSLYSLGRVDLNRISFERLTPGTWLSLSYLSNWLVMSVIVQSSDGKVFPSGNVWVYLTNEREVYFLVEHQTFIHTSLMNHILVSLYKGSYFYRSDVIAKDAIRVDSAEISSSSDLTNIQTKADSYEVKPGSVIHYLNGNAIWGLSPGNVPLGSTCEFQYDRSKTLVGRFDIEGLSIFHSELDKEAKYILHPPKRVGNPLTYYDDLEIFVIQEVIGVSWVGRRLPITRLKTLRQLTHNDYSVSVSAVQSLCTSIANETGKSDKFSLLVYKKETFNELSLFPEANRLAELYRLDDNSIIEALSGLRATVPFWRAESLEKDSLPILLRSRIGSTYSEETAASAIGYAGLTKILYPSPMEVTGEVIQLPGVSSMKRTVYEYTSEGLLLGWYSTDTQQYYVVKNSDCKFIEVFPGVGGEQQDTYKDYPEIGGWRSSPNYNFRVYGKNKATSQGWKDTTSLATFNQGVLKTNLDSERFETVIVTDKTFLARTYRFETPDELNEITVNEVIYFNNGQSIETVKVVPPKQIDVWLNNRILIRGIDYFVKWPVVSIVNKKYLLESENQVSIRCLGFGVPGNEPDLPDEIGFVDNGKLSLDHSHDLRDDKVIRVAAGGMVVTPDRLTFEEDLLDYTPTDIPDGSPYSISVTIPSLKPNFQADSQSLFESDTQKEKTIESYLDAYKELADIPRLNFIEDKYPLFSPFLHRLITDLSLGYRDPDELPVRIDNTTLLEFCSDYLHLLDFEPSRLVDQDYTITHPHAFSHSVHLTPKAFSIVAQANTILLENKINLSGHLEIVV